MLGIGVTEIDGLQYLVLQKKMGEPTLPISSNVLFILLSDSMPRTQRRERELFRGK